MSFCLVTPGTHPLIILGTARLRLLLPDTKFQKCAHTPNLSKLPTEVQSGCFAQSNCIQHPPFAFPKNQLEAGLLKKMHFVSPAGCAMHQAWSDAVGECIETGEELHQGLGRRGCLVSVHLAIMSASPYLHSIAFSIWETRGTRSSESMIVRFPNPLLKSSESFDPFY